MVDRRALERSIGTWPRWLRLVIFLPLAVTILALICAYPSYSLYQAATAEQTTALVERCERGSRGSTTCYGSWTMSDGRQAAGSISGADTSDIGTRIQVWATPRSATTNRWGWWLIGSLIAACVVVAFTVVGRSIRRSVAVQKATLATPTWQPPPVFDARDGRALYDTPVVVVDWQPRGLHGEVRYRLSTPDGRELARGGEPDLRFWRRVSRFMNRAPGRQRHRLVVSDTASQPLFVVDKPRTGVNPLRHGSVSVTGAHGGAAGTISHVNSNPVNPTFHLLDPSGRMVAEVHRSRDLHLGYRISSGTQEMARIVHNATATMTSDAPNRFTLQLRGRPGEPAHTLLLAAPLALNLLTTAY